MALELYKNNERMNSQDRHHATVERNDRLMSPEYLRAAFEANNVFSSAEDPETGKTLRVIDEEALETTVRAIVDAAQRFVIPSYKQRVLDSLARAVGGEPVVTKRGFEAGDRVEKPYLYVPGSSDAATDMVQIKNAEFHRFADDCLPLSRQKLRLQYPTRDGASDRPTVFEARVAALIFHPDHGDGFRDPSSGRLFVRHVETSKYVPFSGEYLRQNGIDAKDFVWPEGTRVDNISHAPRSLREGMAAELPNLVGKGLLKPTEDVKQLTYGETSVAEQRVERVGVSSAGSRMIRGVIHYIGKEFIGKPVKIVDISPQLGAVVDTSGGMERVTHTFNIIPREEAKAGKSNMFLANANLTKTRPFSAETVALPRRDDESLEQYRDRVERTDRGLGFLLLRVFPKYPDLARMLRDKPIHEQTSIAQAAYLLERDQRGEQFDAFVEKYGEDGARTFLVTGNNDRLREQVFEFGRSAPHDLARDVFRAYSSVIDTVDNLESYIQEQFDTSNKEAVNQITTRVLQRAENVLSDAYENHTDPTAMAKLIESVRADAQLFLDSCRVLRSRDELSLQAIRGATIENTPGDQLNEEEKQAIRDLQEKHYANKYPKSLMQELRDGLESALQSSYSRFYLFRKDGELATSVRFDDLAAQGDTEKKHMASFMTSQQYEGGSLGQALLEVALQKETKDNPVYAECDPSLVSFYERFGFRQLRSYTDEHGVPTCDIVLDPQSSSRLEAAE